MPVDIRERSFAFAVRVVHLCRHLDRSPGVPRVLARQVLRAATSIGANLEEAQAGQSKADFIHKNAIALKEARETQYWLRLLGAAEVVPENRIIELRREAEQLSKILGAIVIASKTGEKS